MSSERGIVFHKDYFIKFYLDQSPAVQEKFDFVFKLLRTVPAIPQKFLKHMSNTDGLFEIRVAAQGNIYRVFCCFDKGNIIVLFNAFQKKSQKTPRNEISKALELKEEYFSYRDKNHGK